MNIRFFLRGGAVPATVILLALAFVVSGRLNAQGATSASVLGTVTDPAGAAVPNAPVQVKNVATGQVQQTATDTQGRYTIADLPFRLGTEK